ncbi:hypothetical protein L596_005689 [Steinernema carpocapsae]|uniref:Innexin n=1 Tax=Steinernema carpocapsae TaxID=34508 RepID=A0A4U8V1A0_STECR|nr:hypothetical protein L596_005689 [Steinernema carpocapsae]
MTSPQLGAINSVNSLIDKVLRQPKGDVADRLNSRVTVGILTVSAAVLFSTHFWGSPINCWSPAQFTGHWVEYVNQFCYVHGTYFSSLEGEEPLPVKEEERQDEFVRYYQWVPYILAAQALLFYIPRFVWKSLCVFSGFDLMGAINFVNRSWAETKCSPKSFACVVTHNKDKRKLERQKIFEDHVAVYLCDSLMLGRQKQGRLIGVFYMFATVLQCINAWIQWYWLNAVIDSKHYNFWGPHILHDLANGVSWKEKGHFPRITHCDFKILRPTSYQQETVLCVLHLNIYYEKLFIFLWFWMFFVATVSTINTVWWMITLCRKNASKTVRGYFELSNGEPSKHFIEELGNDGLFMMEQVTLNIGRVPASYLTTALDEELANRRCEAKELHPYGDDSPLLSPHPEKVPV